jgi:hypothetical protein
MIFVSFFTDRTLEKQEANVEKLASEMDDNVVALKNYWLTIFTKNTDLTDLKTQFRTGLVMLAYSYARLAALSFGLQYLSTKNNLEDNPFVTRVGGLFHVYRSC